MSFVDNSDDPFSVAAKRIRSSVIRPNSAPQLPIQGQQQPTTYIIEPDLMETQTGKMNLPNDVAFDDAGFAYNTVTGNPVQIVRRPNVLPIAKTPDGFTPVMPKMLDIAGNVMGNVGGMAGGKVAANAGEMVLGSGAVRTAQDAEALKSNILKTYNRNLPSIKDQYYDWAGKDYSYNIFNKDDIKNIYGEDIPENIKNILTKNDEVVEISSPHNVEYFSKKDAPSLDTHMKEIVSNQGGMFEAFNLDDIMKGLALKVKGGEEAASEAFKSLAKEKGWEISNGVRYFNINKGDKSYNIRISNHPNLTRSNPNAVTPDINIAPGAHDFNDAMTLLSDTRPQVAGAIGHALEKQNQPFYSALERTVDTAKINKASPEQWLGYLKNQPGVKQEELAYVLKDLPESQISKEVLSDIIKNNKVELKEVVKGTDNLYGDKANMALNEYRQELLNKYGNGIRNKATPEELAKLDELNNRTTLNNPNPTKYHDYQLPGAEEGSYKEMLLTLPEKKLNQAQLTDKAKAHVESIEKGAWDKATQQEKTEWVQSFKDLNDKNISNPRDNYKSSHWDEPNILAHVRYNDRNIPDVGKSLHLEEIQSDWHQAGRKQGYKGEPKEFEVSYIDDDGYRSFEKYSSKSEAEKAHKQLINEGKDEPNIKPILDDKGVPDAPFKKSWDELAFKRMLHKAAAEGYDSVSWTPGEAQAARYDLSKHLDSVGYQKRGENTYNITAWGKNGGSVWSNQSATPEMIEQHLGKEMADKIIKGTGRKEGNRTYLEDLDLKVGGEGMKSFYDKMLVDKASSLIKKYGGKVEKKNVNGVEIPYIKLTPELKEKAKAGFPLFSSVPITVPVSHNPFASEEKKSYTLVPVNGNPFQ